MTLHPNNKKLSFLPRGVLAVFLISALATLPASCKKQNTPVGPRERITIGVAQVVLSLPLMIAQEKGYFAEEGLDATIKFYPSGKKAIEGMFAGEADIATVSETPIVFNSFIHEDFVVFASFVYSFDDVKVLGRKDKGVSNPAGLQGRKVGISAGSSSHFFAHIYLAENRINHSAVELIDFAAADLPGALKDGRVDAIVTREPYAYMIMKTMPDRVVRLPRSDLFRETFNLTAMKRYTKERPEMLIKVLRAIDRAVTFIKQNKNESIAVIAKSAKLEEDLLNSVWDDFVFELSLDHSLLTTLEDEARWIIKNGLTVKTKVPNYLGCFYLDAMKAAKPDAAIIVK